MLCRSGARQRALHAGLFETFKAHASVIPLAGLCLAGERRIGDPSPVQQFFSSSRLIPLGRDHRRTNPLYERNESATTIE
jgi:hypothetical protein